MCDSDEALGRRDESVWQAGQAKRGDVDGASGRAANPSQLAAH